MGEAKRRKQTLTDRLKDAPGCVYCACARPANTLDHMPPKAIFSAKQRPKGLEFPCCDLCNAGTKTTDQVAALMSRIYPDTTTPEASAEIQKYLDGVSNNEPGLLTELFGPPEWRAVAERQAPPGQHPLYCAGPLVTRHMETFAAKFGFAMHYELTGDVVGTTGGVAARWYSNADMYRGNFPADVKEILGPATTLRQGKFHVSDQFEYAWALGENDTLGMFLGAFRQSFAVLAFTSTVSRSIFDEPAVQMRTWRPGDLAK